MIVLKFIIFIKLVQNINTESISDLAAFLANSAYKPQYVTSVVWSRSSEDVTDFLKRFHGSVVTTKIQNNNIHKTRELNKAVGYKQTVLFAASAEEFAYFIKSVNLDLVIPIRLILVLTKFVEDLSVITRTAWDNDLADIVIINQDREGNISLTTYFPYGKGVCGDYTPVVLKIDAEELFPKKFRNFHRCPIKVTLIHFIPYLTLETMNGTVTLVDGVNGRIFMRVIEQLNATIDVVSTKDHDGMCSFFNGTRTGCFENVFNKVADILAPAAVINYKRYSLAQISHVYETLDIHWCAPSRRIMFAWAKVLLPLLDDIIVYMFLNFAVFVVVISAIKRCTLHKLRTSDSVLFQTYAIFMGQEVRFETKSYIVNYLFVLWIWICIVFRTAYQGDLIEGIHQVIQEPALGTLENALKAVDEYGGLEGFYELYKDTPLADNFKILTPKDLIPYIKAISAGKRYLILADVLLLKETGAEVQVLDEPVMRAATCLFMRPGWPAAKQVDIFMQYIIESGITVQVMKDYQYEWEKNHQEQKDEHVHLPLDFITLSACFYGLIIMWIVTSIILILEIYMISNKNISSKQIIK